MTGRKMRVVALTVSSVLLAVSSAACSGSGESESGGESKIASVSASASATSSAEAGTSANATPAATSSPSDTASATTPSSPSPAANAKPVSLRIAWWGSDARHKATSAALDLYKKRNPNVEIVAEFSGFPGYFEKQATLFAGGNGPDVFQQNFGFIGQYVKRNQLLDFDKHKEILDLSTYDKGGLSQGVYDGKRFAVSAGANTQALIFDPQVFKDGNVAPPTDQWTWDEFAAAATAVAQAGTKKKGKTYWGSDDAGSVEYVLDVWLAQRGKALYTADGKLGFSEADLLEYWKFWDGLRRAEAVPPADVRTESAGDVASYPLSRGLAAMSFAYSGQVTAHASAAGVELGAVPFPQSPGGQPGQYLIGSGIMWSGNAKTKNPEEVAKLVNFLVNDPEAVKLLGLQRGVPLSADARKILADSATNPGERLTIDFTGKVGGGALAPQNVYYNNPPTAAGEMTSLLTDTYQKLAFGKTDLNGAVKEYFSKSRTILSR